MQTFPLKQSAIETLQNLDPKWFIYSSDGDLYYSHPSYTKIAAGTAVGVKFPNGEEVLFKNVFILQHDPKKIKKALDMAQKLNIIEGTNSETTMDFFYETQI